LGEKSADESAFGPNIVRKSLSNVHASPNALSSLENNLIATDILETRTSARTRARVTLAVASR
jgi:hypothetical protein